MQFDQFTVVLLVRPDGAPRLEGREAAALQDAHMAHLAGLHADGRLLAAGPCEASADRRIVGICLLRLGVPEARELLENDPLVRAGRLRLEVFSWSVPDGTVSFSPSRFPRSMAEAGNP